MRVKLAESPEFAKLKEEGATTKAPLRESFATKDSLKRVLIAFFGIMCAQGAVWYFPFFYMQVFLEKSPGLPGSTKDMQNGSARCGSVWVSTCRSRWAPKP